MDKNIKSFFDEKEEKSGVDKNTYLEKLLKDIEKYVVFTSHCYKYTNPKIISKTTKINIWNNYKQRDDGYIRTGNYGEVKEDAIINATFLPCLVFINLKMEDGKRVFNHLKEDTNEARKSFSEFDIEYDYIRSVILNIKYGETPTTTNNCLRQVYFPVEETQYHLLSLLYPSTGVFYLKNKFKEYYYSEEAKEIRKLKDKNLYSEKEIHDIYDLVEIKYGGSKPQNISYINNIESGTSFLFSSFPPTLQKKNTILPKYNFFNECLRRRTYYNDFSRLNSIFKDKRNNMEIRNNRDEAILNIFDRIIESVNLIKLSETNWSDNEKYNSLPEYQKIILDDKFENYRAENEEVIDSFILEVARWIIQTYSKFNYKNKSNLGDEELKYIYNILLENKEVLL